MSFSLPQISEETIKPRGTQAKDACSFSKTNIQSRECIESRTRSENDPKHSWETICTDKIGINI